MKTISILYSIVSVLVLSTPLHAQSKQEVNKKPNIIFITSDSHRASALSINKHPVVQTPHLDQLAKEGVQFNQAYVATAICVVSRASILTGQHVAKHKINSFGDKFTDETFRNTYPMQLKNNGYRIAQIGTLGVGVNNPEQKFDHWDTKIPWKDQQGKHQIDIISDKVTQFLTKQQKDEPFYLAVSFEAAHEIDGKNGNPATYLVQDRYKDLYKDQVMPSPKSIEKEAFELLPAFLRSEQNIPRTRWHGFFSSQELHQENSRNYYRLITGIDDAVGKIVAKLKSLGLDENTVVIYTSDHGFSLGEHGFIGKWTGFQEAIHVPLIIRDFRAKAAKKSRTDALALNIDFGPTILSYAGVNIPSTMQGINLWNNNNNQRSKNSYFFYEHSILGSPQLPKVEGIVSSEWKYLKYPEHNYEFLFNCKKDPLELNNLASQPKQQKLLEKFRKLYEIEKAKAKI
ncbi:sulfatase-like hydrolase/transferase [Sphingobacterium sp. HJSM2_6]|uniref:sulfatase-like hydrolase/transferase n=1 Tax=Sphingobacterium sp. HJSM2_6 TaxID=3366264 RepID=UPI003BEE3D3B